MLLFTENLILTLPAQILYDKANVWKIGFLGAVWRYKLYTINIRYVFRIQNLSLRELYWVLQSTSLNPTKLFNFDPSVEIIAETAFWRKFILQTLMFSSTRK